MLRVLALALVGAMLMACGDDDAGGGTSQPDTNAATSLSGDTTVFAAASLTAAFEEIGAAFTAENPDAHVEFNFAGSQELRTQLEQGAPADVFASADTKQMDSAAAEGVVETESSVFARNRLVVIVPAANEAAIETLQDLAEPGLKIVLANSDVPVGNYSRQVLDSASADAAFGAGYKGEVLANVVSEESNVKQVAAKVQLDEADAGIVYSSDVTAELAEDVTKIEIPDEFNQLATYPIAMTVDSGATDVAQAFIDFVLGEEGQAILMDNGFLAGSE